jgi:methylglyoxal synthase
MGLHQKNELKKEKNKFSFENQAFISRYLLIATGQMSKKRIKKELKLSEAKYQALENEYLKYFHGKQ